MNMSFCSQCGHPTTSEQRFCTSCGVSLKSSEISDANLPRPDSFISSPPRRTAPKSKGGVSVIRIALGVILGLGLIWVFLPGLLDSRSKSILASENRRSPLVNLAGPQTVVDKPVSLDEDQYGGFGFELKVPGNVTVTVEHERGPKVEVYVMDKKGYDEFDQAAGRLFGGQFHHFPDLAGTVDRSAKVHRKHGGLSAGHYVVLVDNSDFGDVSPPANFNNDKAEVHIKITVE